MRYRLTPRPKLRGVGLANTLVVISIIVVLGFTVAGVSFTHLSVSTRLSNAEIARNRAESVVAMAIDRVITDREAGAPDFNGRLDLPIASGDPAGSGIACFDPSIAASLDIPFSTNNISEDVSKVGDLSRIVPAHGIHVIGVGVCNGVERRTEAILLIPKFPHSIASSGRITSNGGLTVAALDDLSLLSSGGLASVPPDQIEPGDIACNSTNVSQAMDLYGPDIHITGDARAVGGIRWDSTQVRVDGAVKPNSDKSYLPKLDIASYDPAGKPGLVTVSGNQSNLVVNQWTKSDGDLIVSGGLKLDSGVLFVNGNLSVNGGISGKGAVIVTGTTEVFGGGSQATDNMAAILSGGSLRLQASQSDGAQFKGLIYTEGDLTADWVTLGGAAVANAPGAGSEVSLNNVELAYNKGATEFTIPVGEHAGGPPPPPPGPSGPQFPAAPPAMTTAAKYQQLLPNPATSTPSGQVSLNYYVSVPTVPPPGTFFDSATSSYKAPQGTSALDLATFEIEILVDGTPRDRQVVSYNQIDQKTRDMCNTQVGVVPAGVSNYLALMAVPKPTQYGSLTVQHQISANGAINSFYSSQLNNYADMNAYIATNSPPSTWGGGSGPTPPPPPPSSVPVEDFTISINDSTFADLRDKMKVLYWGDPW